jgi:hypothetical protein
LVATNTNDIVLQPRGADTAVGMVNIKGNLKVDGSINFIGDYIQTNTNVYSIDNEIESQEEQLITGQTTLLEVANIGNIPVEQLLEKLNLPNDVDCKEQLGRLKRRYGFEIEDVRNSIIRKPQK